MAVLVFHPALARARFIASYLEDFTRVYVHSFALGELRGQSDSAFVV